MKDIKNIRTLTWICVAFIWIFTVPMWFINNDSIYILLCIGWGISFLFWLKYFILLVRYNRHSGHRKGIRKYFK